MMRDIKTREGFEFWDKLNALPRYAFLLSPSGKSVQKFEDQAMGNWIDVHEAQKVVDQAQDQISELRASYGALGELYAGTQKGFERMQAERDALQLRLNAADQRIDELEPGHSLSPEAASTLRGMVEYCLNHRVCMGMGEGFKSFDPEEEHDFVKELRAFAERVPNPALIPHQN